MSYKNRQIMYAILGTAAGVATIGGSIYYSLASWAVARAKGREEGRRQVLSQLAKFGPNRVRSICSQVGIRFTEPADDGINAERILDEGLGEEIRAALEAELRQILRVEVESEVRASLRSELEGNEALMGRLMNEAQESLYKDLRNSTAVREDVRTQIKRDIRAELARSGRDVALVAEAISELRTETREALRSEVRDEVQNQLRKELEPKIKNELRKEERQGQVEIHGDETGNSWTSYAEQAVTAATKRR